MKQQSFFKFKNDKSHGGRGSQKKRKVSRPLDKNRVLHVVMRSQFATGSRSFRSYHLQTPVEQLIYKKAKIYGVRIAQLSNVGNHLHVLIRFQTRHLLQKFFRVVRGRIASLVTGARKGQKFGRFWDDLVFTRIVSKGMDEARMNDYLKANTIEAEFGRDMRELFEMECARIWKERRSRAKQKRSRQGSG